MKPASKPKAHPTIAGATVWESEYDYTFAGHDHKGTYREVAFTSDDLWHFSVEARTHVGWMRVTGLEVRPEHMETAIAVMRDQAEWLAQNIQKGGRR